MKRAMLLVVFAVLVLVPACSLNPFHKEADVVFQRWETPVTGWRTAVFENEGNKAAANVRVRLKRVDGLVVEGNTSPKDVIEGGTCKASIRDDDTENYTFKAFEVVWIEWD